VLRVAIGLHFLSEGMDKLSGSKPFTSAGFLGSAKGPLAPLYKGLINDPDGYRKLDAERTAAYWTTYRSRVERHYGFDEKQAEKSEQLLVRAKDNFDEFLKENSEELDEYYQQLERRDTNAAKPERQGMETLQTHDAKITSDRMKLKGQLLSQVDALWKNVETDFNNVATAEQRVAAGGPLAIGKLPAGGITSDFVDVIIPWFDLLVGVCLIVGFLTRTAAVLGGLFLAFVCATQLPGSPGAAPIYYQSIEMLALFCLAALGAGKVASIDSLWCYCAGACRTKGVASKRGRESSASKASP
jgi:uncharacterized membrane protein YphA (DoxX/SURF4 family)